MQTLDSKNISLCKLPLREIDSFETACFRTHPLIDIAEDIAKAPRPCNTVSFANIRKNEIGESKINRWSLSLKNFILSFWNELADSNFFSEPNSLISKMFMKMKYLCLGESGFLGNIGDFSETRDWNNSIIRFMSWHPHVFKLAIAGSDDAIRIYSEKGIQHPMLKYKFQKSVTCLSWRPCTIDEIAVGCAAGVILWFSDESEDRMLHLKMLVSQNHFPVTSLEWRSDGLVLATVSVNDSNILIWNVDTGRSTPLRRLHPKCCLIRWALASSRLFCATMERVFRVWRIQETCGVDRLSLKSGRIQSAAWSPCGKILLFVTSDDTKLYRLQQIGSSLFLNVTKEWQALPVADLMPICIGNDVIGGLPQSIVWDSLGLFVAVTFMETNCVAVFRTKTVGDSFILTPHGYIGRMDDEFPVTVGFQPLNSFNENVVLTIGWSNGQVQFCLLMPSQDLIRMDK